MACKPEPVESIRWQQGQLTLLDQRLLPRQELWLEIKTLQAARDAISDLVVRGAPAIGIVAAYAAVLVAAVRGDDRTGWTEDLEWLMAARPTAVNLRWAVERMLSVVGPGSPGRMLEALEHEACLIHSQDRAANQAMARIGAALIEPGSRVLTHCNTGSLATGGTGTALGVIVKAWRARRLQEVYACETRPWLQGLRLTVWELGREDVPCKVLTEAAVAGLMQSGGVDWVITGADRITANGDVANKIGTLMLAVLARHFGARMMVVAPISTLDPATATGATIEIEQRDASEIWGSAGLTDPPEGAGAFNPVFDITPAELIDVIVTERGVLSAPFSNSIDQMLSEPARPLSAPL